MLSKLIERGYRLTFDAGGGHLVVTRHGIKEHVFGATCEIGSSALIVKAWDAFGSVSK
jgi:hypothetical protein